MELENEEAIVKMVELGFGVGIVSKRRLPLPGMKQLSLPVPGVDIVISAAVSSSYVPRRARVFLDICLNQIEGMSCRAACKNRPPEGVIGVQN